MKKIGLTLSLLLTTCTLMQAQTIFNYGNKSVSKDEFLRMYNKNVINKKPDMSDSALRNYVNLYYRFKMKVEEANAAQLDTLPSIKSELSVYKKNSAKTYLTDKDVVNKIVKDAYDRMKQDVEAAHILVAVPRGVGADDTMRYFRKIDSLYNAAKNGADFAALAKTFSDDKATANNGGSIGYFTSLQTPFEFETQAYNLPVNAISTPFRTEYGYHIVKPLAKRPAVGQLVAGQILLLLKKSDSDSMKTAVGKTADSIHKALKANPKSWAKLVEKYNQDKFTIATGGEMKPFGVGAIEANLEKAAFALKNIGDFTTPILTNYGYHIIRLTNRIPVKPFDSIKNEVTRTVERDGRISSAKTAFVNKIKTKNRFVEVPEGLSNFIRSIPDSLAKNNQVSMPAEYTFNQVLFRIMEKSYTAKDLYDYIMRTSRGRLYGYKDAVLSVNYNSFIEQSVLDYEEDHLEFENQEFKNLLQEYRDGIMIFELTDKSVWSKASQDTIGLKQFYDANQGKFNWGPSFSGKQLRCTDEAVAKQFLEEVKTKSFEDALNVVNGTQGYKINVEESRYEYAKQDAQIKNLMVNQYSAPIKNNDNSFTIIMVTKIHPSSEQKTYAEARGYVIADYQDYLETQWIKSMEAKYPLSINEPVLKSIIKGKQIGSFNKAPLSTSVIKGAKK